MGVWTTLAMHALQAYAQPAATYLSISLSIYLSIYLKTERCVCLCVRVHACVCVCIRIYVHMRGYIRRAPLPACALWRWCAPGTAACSPRASARSPRRRPSHPLPCQPPLVHARPRAATVRTRAGRGAGCPLSAASRELRALSGIAWQCVADGTTLSGGLQRAVQQAVAG